MRHEIEFISQLRWIRQFSYKFYDFKNLKEDEMSLIVCEFNTYFTYLRVSTAV